MAIERFDEAMECRRLPVVGASNVTDERYTTPLATIGTPPSPVEASWFGATSCRQRNCPVADSAPQGRLVEAMGLDGSR